MIVLFAHEQCFKLYPMSCPLHQLQFIPEPNGSLSIVRLWACGNAPGLCESDDLLLMRKSRADVGEEGERGSCCCCCEEGVELETPEDDSCLRGGLVR